MIRTWDEKMGQISGFGGSYEDGCRAMVLAGIHWFDEHPDANPTFQELSGVFGLATEKNPDAEALTKAMMDAEIPMDGKVVRVGKEATGAMHHAAVHHVLAYKRLGWDQYVKELEEREAHPEPE